MRIGDALYERTIDTHVDQVLEGLQPRNTDTLTLTFFIQSKISNSSYVFSAQPKKEPWETWRFSLHHNPSGDKAEEKSTLEDLLQEAVFTIVSKVNSPESAAAMPPLYDDLKCF